jgi:hypothetical protein
MNIERWVVFVNRTKLFRKMSKISEVTEGFALQAVAANSELAEAVVKEREGDASSSVIESLIAIDDRAFSAITPCSSPASPAGLSKGKKNRANNLQHAMAKPRILMVGRIFV